MNVSERTNLMRTDNKELVALKKIRQDLQEDAGSSYPNDVMVQLLMLYDVCNGLDLNIFALRDVLGTTGYQAVKDHINK